MRYLCCKKKIIIIISYTIVANFHFNFCSCETLHFRSNDGLKEPGSCCSVQWYSFRTGQILLYLLSIILVLCSASTMSPIAVCVIYQLSPSGLIAMKCPGGCFINLDKSGRLSVCLVCLSVSVFDIEAIRWSVK